MYLTSTIIFTMKLFFLKESGHANVCIKTILVEMQKFIDPNREYFEKQ